jgi:hypothetical protein
MPYLSLRHELFTTGCASNQADGPGGLAHDISGTHPAVRLRCTNANGDFEQELIADLQVLTANLPDSCIAAAQDQGAAQASGVQPRSVYSTSRDSRAGHRTGARLS